MKKRCQNCRTIVSCDNTIIDEEKGYGCYCDVCGSFIKLLSKQINGNVRKNDYYSSYSRRNNYHREYHKPKMISPLSISFVIIGLLIAISTFMISPYLSSIPQTEEQTYSVFILLDNQTDEDISNVVELSILFPKNNTIFDDDIDIRNLNNFEVIRIANASDIKIDVRDILHFYLQIDPFNKTTYSDDYILFVGGINYEYCFYAYPELPEVGFSYIGVSNG